MGKGDEEGAGGAVGALDAGGPGPQAPLLLLPEAVGARSGQAATVGRTAFLVATSFSEAVCSTASFRGPGCQHGLCSCPAPLCISVHPPLGVQMCGILQCPVVLGRSTFFELWMFHWI